MARKTERFGMVPAVVLGQHLTEGAEPVGHGALADFASSRVSSTTSAKSSRAACSVSMTASFTRSVPKHLKPSCTAGDQRSPNEPGPMAHAHGGLVPDHGRKVGELFIRRSDP